MTILRKTLRLFYPLRMKLSSVTGLGTKRHLNITHRHPLVSFYSLSAIANNNEPISFSAFKGKHVLLVNLASNCGYTAQYADLEKLQQQYKDVLVILGFPSNNFGGQEPATDKEIAAFCQVNYGISFPLFKKNSVAGKSIQPVYEWLSNPAHNGWNDAAPTWNFCKYLVNKDGILTHFFSPAVSPLSQEITKLLY